MTNFDLKTLGLADGDYEITVVAKASGYKDSPPSNAVDYVVESDLITFYIGTITNPSVIYHAEPNMTWEQWVNSEYNTVGFKIVNGTVYNSDGSYYIDSVSATDTISNGASYYLFVTPQEETFTIPAGTYVFSDSIGFIKLGAVWDINLQFTCNDIDYLYIIHDTGEVRYMSVYDDFWGNLGTITWTFSGGWEDDIYRTITIKTPQTVSKEFYVWFTENANIQIPAGTYTFIQNPNLSVNVNADYSFYFITTNVPDTYFREYSDISVYDNQIVYLSAVDPDEDFTAYINGSWQLYGGYDVKTITLETPQTVSAEFYQWFVANTLITFTISGTTYQAENGMTWEEWVDSEYNTGGYIVSNDTIKLNGETTSDRVLLGGGIIRSSDTIIANTKYYYGIHSGGSGN